MPCWQSSTETVCLMRTLISRLPRERETELLELTNGERITPVMVEGGVVTVGFHGIG